MLNSPLSADKCILQVGSVLRAAALNSSVFILGRAISGVGAAGLLRSSMYRWTFSNTSKKATLFRYRG